MKEKTGPKTGNRPGTFAKGDDPRRGHGLPGRSGRKPNAFVNECARLTEEQVLPRIRSYLAAYSTTVPKAVDDRTWQWCAEYVTGYGKGKPVQPIDNEGEVPHEEWLDQLPD